VSGTASRLANSTHAPDSGSTPAQPEETTVLDVVTRLPDAEHKRLQEESFMVDKSDPRKIKGPAHLIWVLEKLGLAYDVRWPKPDRIARLKTSTELQVR
jgi:hypothetical protein